MRLFWHCLCLLVSGCLFYIGCPNQFFHFGPVAWVCFVPVLIRVRCIKSYLGQFFYLWLFFQLAFLALFYMDPFEYYQRYETIWMVVVLVAFFVVFPCLFSLVMFCFNRFSFCFKGTSSVLFFAGLWTLVEIGLTRLPHGFPLSFAITQVQFPEMIQLSSFFGSHVISFFMIMVNGFLVIGYVDQKISYFVVSLLIVFSCFLFGWLRIQSPSWQEEGSFSVSLLQPNLAWNDTYRAYEGNGYYQRILNSLVQLGNHAIAKEDPDLLVLPELTMSDFVRQHSSLRTKLSSLAAHKSGLLLGILDDSKNAVVHLGDAVSRDQIYHKHKQVPLFEESVDIDDQFKSPFSFNGCIFKGGMFICFESLFPDVAKRLTVKGANWLGCVSFNSWLGMTNWPLLHASYMPLRAVENGRFSFYLNNHGPSFITNPFGEMLSYIGMGKRGYTSADIVPSFTQTLYQRCGWLLSVFCFLCLIPWHFLFQNRIRDS